jgi:hypothetical protein
MVYRYEKNMKNVMSLFPRCAAHSRSSRALIILACQPAVVKLGMPDLGSCATPVVPKVGGKACEKLPRSSRRRPRLDPRTPSSEILVALPIAVLHLAYAPPSLRGREGANHSHNWLPYVAPPVASVMSRSAASRFRHELIRKIPPVPSPCVFAVKETPRVVCFCDNPSTPPEAS